MKVYAVITGIVILEAMLWGMVYSAKGDWFDATGLWAICNLFVGSLMLLLWGLS